MIEVTDLVKHYGPVPAVRGVSLGVAKGEVVVLIGPSGCGKSTLLRCVHLLEEPTSGTIRVGAQQISFGGSGKTLASRRLAAYRSRIGMVFQHFERRHCPGARYVARGDAVRRGHLGARSR